MRNRNFRACVCDPGWTGPRCSDRSCDPRCSLHGRCSKGGGGACLCVTGWNGRHCTLEGCPRQCSGHGQCRADYSGAWGCRCEAGWEGEACDRRTEARCGDGRDDDGGMSAPDIRERERDDGMGGATL